MQIWSGGLDWNGLRPEPEGCSARTAYLGRCRRMMMSPWLGLTHGLQPSSDLGDLADESDTVAESLAGGWGWVAGEFEDGQSALSFCSASSSGYSLCSRAIACCCS